MCDQIRFHLRGLRPLRRVRGRTAVTALAAAAVLSVFEPSPVRAQTIALPSAAEATATQAPAAQTGPVRQVTIEDAVALALEQNVDLQVQRISPQIQDLGVSVASSGWTPTFDSSVTGRTSSNQTDSFLSGTQAVIDEDRVFSSTGVSQLLGWGGGSYFVGWDTARIETTNPSTTRNPSLSSTFAFNFTQPLLRNFGIDNTRQQVLISRKNREISDVQLQQTVAVTTRNVRNAYWDLVYAIDNLAVQRQSLELAQQSLKDNRARVEIGTMAPIDIIQAEAEVAQREESVILAEASIGRAEDRLRALIYDPSTPDFWTMKIQPSDRATFAPIPIDTDAAVRSALDRRTDLNQIRKQVESNEVNVRFYRNQTLPAINAILDYSALGRGGTQFRRTGNGLPTDPIDPTSIVQTPFGSALGDAFGGDFPTWQFALQFSYPLGRSNADANMARSRLQISQQQKQLTARELAVATQIRDLARSVQTNGKRVESTRAARALAEKRLESEEKKFQAGMTSSFFVVQAQRDLNQARNSELQAVIDHLKSGVDFETAQLAPLSTSTSGTSTSTSTDTSNTDSAVTTTPTGSNATSTSSTTQRQQ
jgi:outer membrane protein